jgi:hypothetical protein
MIKKAPGREMKDKNKHSLPVAALSAKYKRKK